MNMWRLKRKLCPKSTDKPSVKLNPEGKLITNAEQLKQLYKDTYIERLHHREMLPEYRKLFYLKNYLFNIRVEVTSRIKSPDWTEQQLLDVLRKLQNNKSGDHFGLIYELFKPGAIGKD